MDTLVADMGTSMQVALDRIERQMEYLRIGIAEQVKSCIECTFACMQVPELSGNNKSGLSDQGPRPQPSNVGTLHPHPYARPPASSHDDNGAAQCRATSDVEVEL